MSNVFVLLVAGTNLEEVLRQLSTSVPGALAQTLTDSGRCGDCDCDDSIRVDLSAPREPQLGDMVKVWLADRQDLYAEEAVIALKRLGVLDATIDMVRGVNVNYPLLVGEYVLTQNLVDTVYHINEEQGLGDGLVYVHRIDADHEVLEARDRESIAMWLDTPLYPTRRMC